jgi:RIO-like serine/threonine protein kinase
VKAYKALEERGCYLVPRLTAYVFERSQEQIIGFTCEELQGRVAGPNDCEDCKSSLAKFHTYGIVHGDVNKFNIMFTDEGPRFFDLENPVLDTERKTSKEHFSRLQEEELEELEKALRDEEGWGKPWPESEPT